ncbi:cytochrome c oxidase assembly protein cox15 [Phtheirospermum japonicum]|uniref:Cytochrome c oxidase assembly protein cox15 n=1 Tax=Phtheirospermum japonicum TaxID=374723 RepID=A0A830D3J3_9LAMI|nr:cytochrome c oxidase assembly protein cox15 [Phtheirospermum japonicum]
MAEFQFGEISPPVQRVLFVEEATATINEDSSGSPSVNSPSRKRRKIEKRRPSSCGCVRMGAKARLIDRDKRSTFFIIVALGDISQYHCPKSDGFNRLALPVSILVGITAVSGAFVAGNDALRAFNTFPKMGDAWIPEDVFNMKPLIRNFFENTSTVQLDHRILATATLFSIGGLWWSTRKLNIHPAIRSTAGMAVLQVTLGISTLVSYVPVSLGTAHQAGALTLLTLMILLNHTLRRPSLHRLKTLPSVVKTD